MAAAHRPGRAQPRLGCPVRVHRPALLVGGVQRGEHARATQPGRAADLLAAVGRRRRRRDGLPDRRDRAGRAPGSGTWPTSRVASGTIESATAQGGAGSGAAARDLERARRRAAGLHAGDRATPTRTTGSPCRSARPTCGKPPGSCGHTLLAKAKDLYAVENASLSGTSAQATGLPLIVVTLVARPRRSATCCPGGTLAARAHQPGAQRRPGRRGRPPRRLAGLAGRRLRRGKGRPAGRAGPRARRRWRRSPRWASRRRRRTPTRASR